MTEERSANPAELDNLCINTIRFLAVDAIQQANSGHPGLPLGAAPMAYLLWDRFLRHNPADPGWFDRDRFVLSAGHGSMLLYALLHLTGYELPLAELRRFRQWGSKTPGHPERGHTVGVETTTGPLGQGLGNAVGMAIAAAHLAARFNRPAFPLVDHYVYCLAGDGDLMEGVAAEAASLAGHLGLGRLIVLYDDNRISLAAATDLTFTEDRGARFAAYGWQVQEVTDGTDLAALERAIVAARAETARPSLILVRNHIGYGSPHKQDSFEAHGSPLGADEVRLTKEALGWPAEPPFLVPEEALRHCREALARGRAAESMWQGLLDGYRQHFPEFAAEFERTVAGELPAGWQEALPEFPVDPKGLASRVAGGKVLNALAGRIPELVGGSADLNPSTHTALTGGGDFQDAALPVDDRQGAVGGDWGFAGRNIHFGVREHGMAAILNGMAAHGGTIPFGATFLTFADYLRPSLRLAALMGLPVIHIFTHDSIALGEDGPTHQPVEQLASLRAIPNLVVIRPGDANETAVAWQTALEEKRRPVALVLSRQNLPTIDRSCYAPAAGARRGGYVIAEAAGGEPELILIATGSELALALAARERLQEQGRRVRLVSLPSWELFDDQPRAYREAVLPSEVTKRLAVEAGSPFGWERYVGVGGAVLGVDRFGASAPGEVLLREYGFTVDEVCRRAQALLAGTEA
ncbi:transketolase [Geotalea uraniireducens]|uniref:Transketolase n=1 Tax=Geotalea uraniireducens TaxID=351604 RepID=A0ABM8EI81_9BACT|nr:transketolase [Geotalea uraniireducens]BDV42199.1 transketolase [Geotalea uraniireducens]